MTSLKPMAAQLPASWRWVSLEELTEGSAPIVYGIIQAGPEVPGGVPYIRPTELVDGGIDVAALKHTSPEIAVRYQRAGLKAGDIVLAIVGTIGKLAIVPPELDGANITQSSARIRPPPSMSPQYLAAALQSPQLRRQFDQMEFGVAVRRLNIAHVRALELPVAPVAEQRRIVAKLEALQTRSRRAREALDAVPPLLEKLRQSILAAAFRGDLTKDWRAKNKDVESASKLLERIRAEHRKKWEESEVAKMRAKGKPPTDEKWKAKYRAPSAANEEKLPKLPNGWCWGTVDELCPGDAPAVYGIILPGEDVPGGIPYVRPIDMRDDGTVNLEALKRASSEIAAQYSRARLSTGDVVLSIVGTIGKVIVVPPELDGANITQSSARIRPPRSVPGQYLALALQSPILIRQFDAVRFGNAVQRLNVEHVRELAIPLAPERELTEVVRSARLALARMPEAQLSALRSRMDEFDRSILAKAFRGELVPQDPNDEPAAVMLNRVRASLEEAAAVSTTKSKRASKRKAS